MKKLILFLAIFSIFPLASSFASEEKEAVDCAAIVDGEGKTPSTPTSITPEKPSGQDGTVE